ncbi:MAG: Hydroxyacylglutathione hydrolase [Cyanobacteriota bacterium]|jgi:hydroxyacylglutathione hydrolase
MEIHLIPALRDNYIFLLHDRATQSAVVVDPGEAAPVVRRLRQLDAKLVAIWNTHRHRDHMGGNAELLAAYPGIPVYGSPVDRGYLPGQTHFLKEGDRVEFAGRSAIVMALPGHLHGHIAYYFAPTEAAVGELFIGDVIFSAGCGRIFDGPIPVAVQSIDRLRQLPDSTRVWCAHEYTLTNLKFALAIDPENLALQDWAAAAQRLRHQNQPTIPTTIGRERQINPFLRWDVPNIQQAVGMREAAAVFGELRRRKEMM